MTRQPPSLGDLGALDEYLSEILGREYGVDSPLACLVKLKLTQHLNTPQGQSAWERKSARRAERYVLRVAKDHAPMLDELRKLVQKIVKKRFKGLDANGEDIIQYVMMYLTSPSGVQYLDPERTNPSNLGVKIKMLIMDGFKHLNAQYQRSMITHYELDESRESDSKDEEGHSDLSPEDQLINHDTRAKTTSALERALQDLDDSRRDQVIVYHWDWLIDWLTPEALVQLCSAPLQGHAHLSDILRSEASASRRLEVIFFSSISDPTERAKAVSATRKSADRAKPMIRTSLERAGIEASWLRDEGGEDE